MASGIVHMAIAKKLAEKVSFSDMNRLMLGEVIPDFSTAGNIKGDSHLKIKVMDGRKSTYDFDRFRGLFGERMLTDDLYLGYYLHLVQDILYRHYVYDRHGWNPSIPGNVEKLHNDYRIVNWYVISKYGLKNNIAIPENFDSEELNKICSFDTQGMTEDMKRFFQPMEEEPIFFFTKEMTDEFIAEAAEFCEKELERLRKGEPGIDMTQYAWSRAGKQER